MHPRPEGLYCPPGDFYIDPIRPVERALITHGHSDHARAGHGSGAGDARDPGHHGACATARISPATTQAAALGETLDARRRRQSPSIPPATCSARPSRGRGWRHAHRRLRRLQAPPDPTCPPFEPVRCDVFITEATFGLPVFRHPPDTEEIARLLRSVAQFPERAHLVGAYALGKAQRVIRLLRDAGYDEPIYIHGALARLSDYYQSQGIELGALEPATVEHGGKGDFAGAIVVGPPSAFADRWARRFPDPVSGFASGWMRIRQRARQRGVELPLIISDHADWDELTGTIHETGRRRSVGHPRPRGSAGALVRAERHRGPAAAPCRLRGRGRLMDHFAELLDRLVLTPSRNGKLTLLTDYFARSPDPDRGLALAAITGDLTIAAVKPAMLRMLVTERIDPVLFGYSYDYVGDLAETISLVWPEAGAQAPDREPSLPKSLTDCRRRAARRADRASHRLLDAPSIPARFAIIKLVTGGLRVGVSARLAKQALADFGDVDVAEIEELWHGLAPPYPGLFAWLEGKAPKPEHPAQGAVPAGHAGPSRRRRRPRAARPGRLRRRMEMGRHPRPGGAIGGTRRLYSRTGDDISGAFPDLVDALDFDAAIDGELLVGDPPDCDRHASPICSSG